MANWGLCRYGWLHVQAAAAGGFTVTNFTAVCQAIPINYGTVDSFVANAAVLPAITSTASRLLSQRPREPYDCRNFNPCVPGPNL